MATTTDPIRLAMLARVERGELDNSAAAKELGLTPGVWGLWRARHAKAAGSGKAKPAKKAAKAKPPKKDGRGRKADPAETARRVAMFERVQAGELNNAAAAKELGIKVGAWGVWKSGYIKRAGGAKRAAGSTAKPRRGRRKDAQHTALRSAMLARVEAGELTNGEAAEQLGLRLGTWAVWKSNYLKQAGRKRTIHRGRPPGSIRRGRPPGKATTRASAPIDFLAGVVAQLEGMQRFGEELRERVRAMVELVQRQFPG